MFFLDSATEQICWSSAIAIGSRSRLFVLFQHVKQPTAKKEAIVHSSMEVYNMREEYDFSSAVKNPYAKRLKKQITINIDTDTIEYFKSLSVGYGIPYQTLINLYLSDCAANKRRPTISWQ